MKSILPYEDSKRLRRRTLYFLLSLLAHIVIFVGLFLYKDDRPNKRIVLFDTPKKLAQNQQQAIMFKDPVSDLPASLKPRKSDFGTLAYVDDVAQAVIPKQSPEQDLGLIEKGEEIKDQPRASQQELVHIEPVKSDTDVEKKLQQIQEIEAQQRRFAELSERVVQGEEISILKKKPVQPEPGTEFQPKRKSNIIAMTKGYIENLTQEGDDWLKRDGDDSKRPTLEEMKFFSYEQRINWQLQSSWKHNFERSINAQVAEGRVVVTFLLDEQGNVTDTQLIQSSGFKMLDTIVLQNVKAASPFPPVPKHFNMKTYKVSRIIQVTFNRFGI